MVFRVVHLQVRVVSVVQVVRVVRVVRVVQLVRVVGGVQVRVPGGSNDHGG